MQKTILFLAMLLLCISSANAQNLLTNPGFEAPALGDGIWDTTAPTGWYWGPQAGSRSHGDPLASELDAYEGVQVVEIGGTISVDQDVALTVGADEQYTFTVQAYRPSWEVNATSFVLFIGWDGWDGWATSTTFSHNTETWGEYSFTLDTSSAGNGAAAVGASVLNVEVFSGIGLCLFDGMSLTLGGEVTPDPNALPATNPRPVDGAENVALDTLLRWTPGVSPVYGVAAEHQVYLGTDENTVTDATTPDATISEDGDSFSDLTGSITNPSFDSDALSDGTKLGSGPTGWDAPLITTGARDVWDPPGDGTGSFDSAVPDGDNVIELGDGLTLSEAYQYVPVAGGLQSGQIYMLSVQHAGLASGSNTTWVRVGMHASLDTSEPNDLWGPPSILDVERADTDRDWQEYNLFLDVDALGVAGYDGLTFGMTAFEFFDPSYYDDVRLGVYVPANDPNYDPTLQNETEYFWRIDEVFNKGGGTVTRKGDVWSFKTPVCGQTGQYYSYTDINQDCYTDLKDFALFALDWLNCTDPADQVNCDPWQGP